MPKNQVIDTVDLYTLRVTQRFDFPITSVRSLPSKANIPENRKLSLRFLAWVVLSDHIQTETHDSIEDSRTALRLYRKYLEYEDAGVVDEVFDRIYSEGLRNNFRPPLPVLSPSPSSSPDAANNGDATGIASTLSAQLRLQLLQEEVNNPLPNSEMAAPQPRFGMDGG